jgi:hypothetical protein
MRIITYYLLALTFAVCVPYMVFASPKARSKEIDVIYEQQLHLNIANEAVNRINFDNQRIVKIIGNTSGFNSILSDDGSNLFIAPQSPLGSKIDFAVLLASGDVIDLSLNVVKSKIPYLTSLKFPNNSEKIQISEARSMINAMRNKQIGKYYVQENTHNITLPKKQDLRTTIYNSYRFGNLHGNSLTLQNKNRFLTIEINAAELAQIFSGIRAVHVDKKILAPREKTKAYIVFKGKEV